MLRFKIYRHPNITIPKIIISRIVRFFLHSNYSVPRFVNHAVVLTCAANATLDQSEDLQSQITRDYFKKLCSMVRTHFDE